MPPSDLTLPLGTPAAFDDFKVDAYLGAGAYGYVYRVTRNADEFALKWLQPSPPPKGAERLKNEQWALKQANHPSIPKLIGEGVDAAFGRPFYVMSLARGETLETHLENRVKEGAWFSELQVINLLVLILDAVNHLHQCKIFHRDIKHNNIIADISLNRIWLIDLGSCSGEGRPFAGDTFWNIGASRFAPPQKLKHPAIAVSNHDVFSIGVVGYILLTRNYPWSVARGEDAGALREQMERQPPIPIETHNNTYSRDLTDFIGRLIVTDDKLRPEVDRALEEARELQSIFSERETSSDTKVLAGGDSKNRTLIFTRVIRDPLHGDIRMTDFEWQVISTPEFQRLRNIKQLGLANLVYPGAEHTRFLHCLGSLYITDKILKSMQEIYGTITGSAADDVELRQLARVYALVHDITHIAFGHTLEDELGLFPRHDSNLGRISRLVLSGKSRLGELLRSTDYGRIALYHFDPQATVKKRAFVEDLLSSSCGADVLDYIDRDGYFCGLDDRVDSAIYRRFAFENSEDGGRLLSQSFGKHGRRLDVNLALENLRMARFALFMKVYTHPVKIAAGAMLGKAVSEALLSKGNADDFAEAEMEWMGDDELLLYLRDTGPKLGRELAARIMRRQLYEPLYTARAMQAADITSDRYRERRAKLREIGLFDPIERRKLEQNIAKRCKVRPGQVILYCAPSAPGYSKAIFRVSNAPGRIGVKRELLELELLKRHASLWIVYAFVPPELSNLEKQRIAEEVQNEVELDNDLAMPAVQATLPLWHPT